MILAMDSNALPLVLSLHDAMLPKIAFGRFSPELFS